MRFALDFLTLRAIGATKPGPGPGHTGWEFSFLLSWTLLRNLTNLLYLMSIYFNQNKLLNQSNQINNQ